MSSPPTAHENGVSSGTSSSDAVRFAALLKPLEVVGFWAGITLPFLYVPLFLSGLETPAARTACFALIALHAVALFVGRRHNRERSE